MRKTWRVFLVVLCLGLISGCAKSVTLQDIPVSGRAESIAKAIRITDISAAAAGSFLIALYDSRKISESTYRQYTDTIGPAVQAALDESREALKAYIATQSMPAYDKLQTAFGGLAEAAERLTDLARTHGWGA